ncbi:MAG: hypothetical protein EOP04_13730 [Proteobacteria bacterium]|nr:MAG: hypothetical protein EOP04_13730 [Pseudomonadota bacterium]
MKYFQTEKEIVEYALAHLQQDQNARAHCIGFTTLKDEALELGNRLQFLGIRFFQDEFPYYGLSRLVYRTFVYGCDYKRVEDLKAAYYKGPN